MLGVSGVIVALVVVGTLPAWSMAALPVVLASSELSPVLALLALLWLPITARLFAPTSPLPIRSACAP